MFKYCEYDEAYTKADAEDFGWCKNCKITSCNYNRITNCNYNRKSMKNAMDMTLNDYARIIEKKDAEIRRLKKIVEEVTENIKVVGKQNTRLKKKCERYEKRLSELYLNGDFK